MGMTYTEDKKQPILLMTYFPGKTLTKWLYKTSAKLSRDQIGYFERKENLSPLTKLDLIIAILKSVHAFHKLGLYHRDLKPDNLIIHKDMAKKIKVSLIDLTDTIPSSAAVYNVCGSFGYIAPSSLVKKKYGLREEYFSLFVIIAEILSEQNYQESLKKIMEDYKTKDYLPEFGVENIKNILFDVFKPNNTKLSIELAPLKNEFFIFNLLILPFLQEIIIKGTEKYSNKMNLEHIIAKLTKLRDAAKDIIDKYNALDHLASEALSLVDEVLHSDLFDLTEDSSEEDFSLEKTGLSIK
jgi:serine/threonine protein kinase